MKIGDKKLHPVGQNVEDIIAYAKVRRPDVLNHLPGLLDNQGIMFVAAIAYAAGRASVVAEVNETTIESAVKEEF